MAARTPVYVGQKARGVKDPVVAGVKNINATSGSMNLIDGSPAKGFSPMLLGPVDEHQLFGAGDATALNFENYWQYGKVFPDLGHNLTIAKGRYLWRTFRDKGYAKVKADRHPVGTKSKEIKYTDEDGRRHWRYFTATSACYFGSEFDYLTSRKRVYVPGYAALVMKTKVFAVLKAKVEAGERVQILDFDVSEGSHQVTLEFLRDRVNDPSQPFGHGYVLAGLLAGILPELYC